MDKRFNVRIALNKRYSGCRSQEERYDPFEILRFPHCVSYIVPANEISYRLVDGACQGRRSQSETEIGSVGSLWKDFRPVSDGIFMHGVICLIILSILLVGNVANKITDVLI